VKNWESEEIKNKNCEKQKKTGVFEFVKAWKTVEWVVGRRISVGLCRTLSGNWTAFVFFSFTRAFFVSIFCVRFPAHANLSNPCFFPAWSVHHPFTSHDLSNAHSLTSHVAISPRLLLLSLPLIFLPLFLNLLRVVCRRAANVTNDSGDQTTHNGQTRC